MTQAGPCSCVDCIAIRWEDYNSDRYQFLGAFFAFFASFIVWSVELQSWHFFPKKEKTNAGLHALYLHSALEVFKPRLELNNISTNWLKPCSWRFLEVPSNHTNWQEFTLIPYMFSNISWDQEATLFLGRLAGSEGLAHTHGPFIASCPPTLSSVLDFWYQGRLAGVKLLPLLSMMAFLSPIHKLSLFWCSGHYPSLFQSFWERGFHGTFFRREWFVFLPRGPTVAWERQYWGKQSNQLRFPCDGHRGCIFLLSQTVSSEPQSALVQKSGHTPLCPTLGNYLPTFLVCLLMHRIRLHIAFVNNLNPLIVQ